MTEKTGKDETLHQRILNDIESRIMSGEWQPGHRLPFEVDMAASYSCSRMTVNKVMSQLAKAGLIERRKKSGSFVTQPRAQSAILDIHDIKEEVSSLHLAYRYKVLSLRKRQASAEDIRRLTLSTPHAVIEVACLHYASEKPFCMEERLISLAVVPQAADFDFKSLAPGPWLLSQIPWTTAEHRIQAITAGPKETKNLDIAPRDACLLIERLTWGPNGPVTYVQLTYPGNRHVVTAQFNPGG
ncbi:histidine utilization repressor [Agrobacterium rosae]|uniref:histidine utilization repressor n=1 Tax=Agrobacterium rosae TaxID=1972867 RepID=UPI003BA05681